MFITMKNSSLIKQISLFDFIFILALSVFSASIYNVYKYHEFRVIGNPETIYFVLFSALFFFGFTGVLLLIHFLEKKFLLEPVSDIRIFTPDIKGFFKGMLLISVCYLPVAIIFYPGVCSWDTINQLYDFLTGDLPIEYNWGGGQEKISAFLNDHHPVFDTLIYVAFYKIGESAGDPRIGIFIYSLVSMVCTSGAFSYMLCLINRLNVRLPKVPLLLFVLLMPVLAVYSFAMLKDSLFGIVFVWYFSVFTDVLLNKPSKKKMTAVIVLSVLLCLTKKTGIYIVIPADIALLFAGRPLVTKYKGFVLPAFLIPVVLMFFILPKVIFPAANVWPGGKQEMLGPLFQQSARVELDKPDYYSEEERKKIDKVFDFEHIRDNYKYEVSDGIKDTYRLHSTDEERKEYLNVWVHTGLKNPLVYVKATAGNSGGFFAPVKTMQLYTKMKEQTLLTGINNPESLTAVREGYVNIYNFISSLPVINLLFSNVLYVFWIPVFMIVRAIKRKYRNLIITTIPVIVSVFVFIVSPVSNIRYGIHLVYLAPLLIAIGILSKKDRILQTDKNDISTETYETWE